jgi:alpha-amylase
MSAFEKWLECSDKDRSKLQSIEEAIKNGEYTTARAALERESLTPLIKFTESSLLIKDFCAQPEQENLWLAHLESFEEEWFSLKPHQPLRAFELIKGVYFYSRAIEQGDSDTIQSEAEADELQFLEKSAESHCYYAYATLCERAYQLYKKNPQISPLTIIKYAEDASKYHWTPGYLLLYQTYLNLAILNKDNPNFYQQALDALLMAKTLSEHQDSINATNNAYLGEGIIKGTKSQFVSWDAAASQIISRGELSPTCVDVIYDKMKRAVKNRLTINKDNLVRYHFLMDGNGILSCYDMYPTQFRNLHDMTHYLPTLKELGFNAVWINPLQLPGDLNHFYKRDKTNGVIQDNEVTRSLYAMSDPLLFNPQFSVASADLTPQQAHALNCEALRSFTNTARKLGLVPMFDLVLNHLAIDTPLFKEKPHWFNGIHDHFKDVRGFNYGNEKIRGEIIRELWQPYVRRYMLEYGFDGVRVDAVGHVHPQVRQAIYDYIHHLAEEHGKPNPVILDEALFSKRPLAAEVDYLMLTGAGPTHITTEVYNHEFNADGSLPLVVSQEEQLKANVVFTYKDGTLREDINGGCVNFCGNHDYRSLAMTILFHMAKQRVALDPSYHELMSRYQTFFPSTANEASENLHLDDVINSTLLYSYVTDIQNELLDKTSRTAQEFETLLYEKLSVTALTGSGGWFLLSGDETSDPVTKTVFQRKNTVDLSYYPQQEHAIFSENPLVLDNVIKQMAEESFIAEHLTNEPLINLYQSLSSSPEMQKRFLIAHIDNIHNQINAGTSQVVEKFCSLLSLHGIFISSNPAEYIAKPRTCDNGWLGLHNNFEFIKQLNWILKSLPKSICGYSSELIRLPEKAHLVVVVRKNGLDLDAPIDIVAVNLNQHQRETLTTRDMHQIAKQYCMQYALAHTLNPGDKALKMLYNNIVQCSAKNKVHVDSSMSIETMDRFCFETSSVATMFRIAPTTPATDKELIPSIIDPDIK